jgi:serine O-acetyltransferase
MSPEKKGPPLNSGKRLFSREENHTRREIPRVVNGIMQSFLQTKTLAHLDAPTMPDEPSVVEILNDVRALLFPGYHGRYEIESHNLVYYIGEICVKVFDELSAQISRACRNDCNEERRNALCPDCDEYGRMVALKFLEKIPEIRSLLSTDVRAAYEGDPAAKSADEIIFSYPGLKAIVIFRIAHALALLQVPILPRMMTEYAHRLTGIDIHPGASIGEGFFIDHGTGVVIGETTVIGKNVQIYQGVTLGALRFPKDADGNIIRGIKRHPTIEDNVTIYAQATILGDSLIGEGSVIGGNTWLTHSIPKFSIVLNEHVKITLKENINGVPVTDYDI